MDALWQEKDEKWQAIHSCGHDSHSTMALGVALLFNKMGYKPPGKLKILFQPAEEKGTGALKMLQKGFWITLISYMEFIYVRSRNCGAAMPPLPYYMALPST